MSVYSNLEKRSICRSCMQYVKDSLENIEKQEKFHEMFHNCTGLAIQKDDNLPKLFCDKCTEELKIAYNFRSKALATHKKLLATITSYNNDKIGDTSHDYEKLISHLEVDKNIPGEFKISKLKENAEKAVCYICGENFLSAKEMMSHKTDHFIYKCKKCELRFKTGDEIMKHKCDTISFNSVSLQVFSKLNYKRILKCHICDQELMYTRSLRHHLRSHTGEKPCLCPICGLKFREEKALINHTRAIHTKEKRFKCTFCPKEFTVSGKRRLHERVHTGEKPYQCEQCLRLFGTRCALTAHTRRHTKQNVYKCNVPGCDKGFYTFSSYQRHNWAHRGERPYECNKCNNTYLSKQNLLAHQKSVHSQLKDQVCNICEKKFSEKSTLNRHLRSIHKVEPQSSKKPVAVYGIPAE